MKAENSRRGSTQDPSLELRFDSCQGESQRQGGGEAVGLGAGLEGGGRLGTGGDGESGAAGDGSISYDEDSSAVSESTPMLSFAGQDAFHSPNRKEQLCVTAEDSHHHHRRHQHQPHHRCTVQPQSQQPDSHKREVFVEVYPTPRSSVCPNQSTTSRTELFRGIHTKSFSDHEISRLTRDRPVQQFILLEVFSVALFKPPKPAATTSNSAEVSDDRPVASDATSMSTISGPTALSPTQVASAPVAAAPASVTDLQMHSSPSCARGQREKRNESMPELWKCAPCSEALRPYGSDIRLLSPKSQRHCPLHHSRQHYQHPYHNQQHLTQQQQQQQQQELKKPSGPCCSQTAEIPAEKVEPEMVVQRVQVPQDLWQLRAILANESEADSDESEGIVELTSVEIADIPAQVDALLKEARITPPNISSISPAAPSFPICCTQIGLVSPNTVASTLTCQSTTSQSTPESQSNLVSAGTIAPGTNPEVFRQPVTTSDVVDVSTLPEQPTSASPSPGEPCIFGTIAEKDEDSSAVTGDPLHREPSIRRQTYRKAIAKRQRRHELLPPKPDDEVTDTESSLSLEKSASIPAASTSVESFRDSTTSTDSTGENHAYRLEQLRGDSGYKSLETQQSLGTRFDFRQTYFVPEEGSIIREDEPVSPMPLHPIGKVVGGERRIETVFPNDAVALLSKIAPSMPSYFCYQSGATKRTLKSKAAEKKRIQYKSDRQAVQVYDSVHEQETPVVSGGTSTVTAYHHGQSSIVTAHHHGSSSTVTTHHHGPSVATHHQLSSAVSSHSGDVGPEADSGKQSTKSSSSSLFSRLLKSHSRRPLVRMQRDYSIDERSDALFNEFIRHDPTYDAKHTLCVTSRSPRSGHRQHRSRTARSSTDLPAGQGDVLASSDGPSTAATSVELRRRRHEARRRRHESRDVEDAATASVTDCLTMLDALNRKSLSDSRTTTKTPDDGETGGEAVEGFSEVGKLSVGVIEEGSSTQLVPRLSPTFCRNKNIPLIQLTEDEDI